MLTFRVGKQRSGSFLNDAKGTPVMDTCVNCAIALSCIRSSTPVVEPQTKDFAISEELLAKRRGKRDSERVRRNSFGTRPGRRTACTAAESLDAAAQG